MSNESYIIKRLSADNLNDLTALHTVVYKRILPAGFLVKKYNTTYTGVEFVGFVAYDNSAPVAFYGVIPCFLRCNNEPVLAAQSADTMTHPNHQKRGLFILLATKTYDLCIEAGIKIVFGFPNQNSLPGFLFKLNWQLIEKMECFIIPVKTIPLEKIAAKIPFFKNAYSDHQNRCLRKYIVSIKDIDSIKTDGFDGVARDEKYFEYKSYSDTRTIIISNVTIWFKVTKEFIIGDLSGIDENNFKKTMNKLIKLAGKLGLTEIQFHASPGIKLHALFSKHYKAIPSFPVIFKDLGSQIPTGRMKFTFADIDIF